MKGYKKIAKFSDVISYFAMHEWKFCNKNTQNLYKKLSPIDKNLFCMSMKEFSWDEYAQTYVVGCRVYLLKDPLETIPKGKIKYRVLQVAHYTLVTFLLYLLYKFLMFMYFIVFT